MPIEVGDKRQEELTVTPEVAVHFLEGGAPVLGTPFLIYHLEITGRNLVLPKLEPGHDTVGTLVNVRHLAATPVGMKVSFHAEVVALEGRMVRFQLEAFDEKEKIADGIHERFIIDVARFSARVQAKLTRP
jgi:predicted thioesterase